MARLITVDELKQHKDAKSLWIAIHDKVYDVTKFVDEHPGGEEILLEQAGGYGTDAFDDVGHSNDAKELMKKYLIGSMAEGSKEVRKDVGKVRGPPSQTAGQGESSWSSWLLPLGIALVVTMAYRYFTTATSSASA